MSPRAKAPRKSPSPGRRKKAPASETAASAESDAPSDAEPALEPELAESEVESEVLVDDTQPPKAAMEPAGSALTRFDPLQQYMTEVHRHPLLSRDEEQILARRYRDEGDLSAAARLVSSNLRLVVKLAHDYHRNPLSLLDLIQEGNIGLMQAVKKYDPERGVKLSTYAAWWIRAYILRYIMENWKMVKLGTTEAQRKLFFRLRQEQEKLSAQGYAPTAKLLAERLDVSEQDVVEMDQRLTQDEVSLDLPVGEDGTASRLDRMLPSGMAPADEQLADEELKRVFRTQLATFAETLSGKERYIFDNRLTSDEPMTLQEIGKRFGVSRERARQIEAALIARIREYVKARIPDFDLVTEPNR